MNFSPSQKKVLIVTYYWPPAGGPGVMRWVKFAKYLCQLGYEIYVITVDEKLASYALSDKSLNTEIHSSIKVFRTKTREFYNTYLRISKKEIIPFSGFVNESKPGVRQKLILFIRSHFFIPDPRRGWNTFAYNQAFQLINNERIPIVITTSPPHSTQLIGKRLKKHLPAIRWIADFRDPWTDVFYFDQLCHSPLSRGVNKSMERSILKLADKVLVVSESMKSDFVRSHTSSILSANIHVISNGFDEEDFIVPKIQTSEEFTISYVGTLALNYTIDTFLDAIRELRIEMGIIFRLRFIGEICPEYRSILASDEFNSIAELIPRVPHEKAIHYLLSSHLLLLVIPQAPKNESILTGKLFEYMAARKPILGIGPVHGDASHLLAETKAGKMFEYMNKEAMKAYLVDLYKRKVEGEELWQGKNIDDFSRANLAKQLTKLF
jgi:glycosyltransferase involved in cell wall biosynthesis